MQLHTSSKVEKQFIHTRIKMLQQFLGQAKLFFFSYMVKVTIYTTNKKRYVKTCYSMFQNRLLISEGLFYILWGEGNLLKKVTELHIYICIF